MNKVTCDVAISVDGFVAGPNQSESNPLGLRGELLHRAATINQYLAAGLIDELRLHVSPMLLGEGERLFDGVGDLELEPLEVSGTKLVTHVTYLLN